MSDVAAYHILVCVLFPVQGGMWTAVHIIMSDVAAYHVCALFPVQGGMWTAVHISPCTGNNAHTNT